MIKWNPRFQWNQSKWAILSLVHIFRSHDFSGNFWPRETWTNGAHQTSKRTSSIKESQIQALVQANIFKAAFLLQLKKKKVNEKE